MTINSFSWCALAALLSISTVGCKGKNSPERICEDGCQAFADCDDLGDDESEADCRSECEDLLEDADKDCREAFRDFVDCYASSSCDDEDACISESLSLFGDCPELLEELSEDVGGEEDCCGSTDTCAWANDGFCDCGGIYDWDAADCQ